MNPLWLVMSALLLLSVVGAVRRSRSRRLATIRATWGEPIDRTRRMDAMSASHAARIAGLTGAGSLDERIVTMAAREDMRAIISRVLRIPIGYRTFVVAVRWRTTCFPRSRARRSLYSSS